MTGTHTVAIIPIPTTGTHPEKERDPRDQDPEVMIGTHLMILTHTVTIIPILMIGIHLEKERAEKEARAAHQMIGLLVDMDMEVTEDMEGTEELARVGREAEEVMEVMVADVLANVVTSLKEEG